MNGYRRVSGRRLQRLWADGDPLLRNGVLLTLASLATSGLGAAYWSLAGLRFGVATVGRNFSAVSMMMFLAGLSQLNLADVLVRFVPAAGRSTRRLINRAYAAGVGMALLTSVGFVLLVPWISPGLYFLHTPVLGGTFVLATVAYTVFVLQDGALTGLRRPGWVLAENAFFSVVKLVAVLLLSLTAVHYGILISWALALLLALVFTNTYLYGYAMPRRERELETGPAPVEPVAATEADGAAEAGPGFVRFTALSYLGGLFWLAMATLPQVLILNTMGARDSAYFSICWVITTMYYVVSINMGSSLVVESAGDPQLLGPAIRTVLRSTGALLLAAVVVLLAAAPLVLRLFGPDYPVHAATLLRLLTLSALPNLVTATAMASYRVRRRLWQFVLLNATLAGSVFGLGVVLVPRVGLVGMGWAWLTAQLLVAAVLLGLVRSSWLPTADGGRPNTVLAAEARREIPL